MCMTPPGLGLFRLAQDCSEILWYAVDREKENEKERDFPLPARDHGQVCSIDFLWHCCNSNQYRNSKKKKLPWQSQSLDSNQIILEGSVYIFRSSIYMSPELSILIDRGESNILLPATQQSRLCCIASRAEDRYAIIGIQTPNLLTTGWICFFLCATQEPFFDSWSFLATPLSFLQICMLDHYGI